MVEDPMRIAIGIATAGRPAILRAALVRACNQTRAADLVLVSAPSEADAAEAGLQRAGCKLLVGQRGLTRQRNEIIARAGDCNVLVLFDDDFLPDGRYLARVEEVFSAYPDVVLTTGTVIKDGITGPRGNRGLRRC